jgi:hypothetical protein
MEHGSNVYSSHFFGEIEMREMPVTNHAVTRAWERYGIRATKDEWQQAVSDILFSVEQKGPAIFLSRENTARERWGIRLQNRWVRVVWSPILAIIVTALPPMTERTWRLWGAAA